MWYWILVLNGFERSIAKHNMKKIWHRKMPAITLAHCATYMNVLNTQLNSMWLVSHYEMFILCIFSHTGYKFRSLEITSLLLNFSDFEHFRLPSIFKSTRILHQISNNNKIFPSYKLLFNPNGVQLVFQLSHTSRGANKQWNSTW